MQSLPDTKSFSLLLAWSRAVETRRGWVKLDAVHVPELAGMSEREIQACVSELTGYGFCTPAAHGELVYISAEGARLARAARELLGQGVKLEEITLEVIASRLPRSQFFRLPHPLTARTAGSKPTPVPTLAAG